MIEFAIEKEIATIGNKKELRLVSWNGHPAKLDIRTWYNEGKPGKGMTFSDEEGRALLDALRDYFDGGDAETP